VSSDQNVLLTPSCQKQTDVSCSPLRDTSDEIGFLRLPEVKSVTGLSKSSLYALIRANSFPAPVQLGPRTVAWVRSEIKQWAEERIKASRTARPRPTPSERRSALLQLGLPRRSGLRRSRFPALSKLLIQVVRPTLHHLRALLEILRMVISSGDLIAFRVGELQLNVRFVEFMLIENGRCQSTEPVPRHSVPISKPVQGIKDPVVADRLFLVAGTGKDKVAMTCDLLERTQTSTA
jgi:prophage regulatory protein